MLCFALVLPVDKFLGNEGFVIWTLQGFGDDRAGRKGGMRECVAYSDMIYASGAEMATRVKKKEEGNRIQSRGMTDCY